MKKLAALILTLCIVLAAAAACAETDMYILYNLENPEGEDFTAGEAENFPFYVIGFDSDGQSAVLYNDDQDPLNGVYEVAETDDENVILVTISFENDEQIAVYGIPSEHCLIWVDDENWTNTLISMRDYPDREAAQLKLDSLNGMTTYVLTSITLPDGQVQTAEDDIPHMSMAFCKEPATCIVRTGDSVYEYAYEAEVDEETDTMVITLTSSSDEKITVTGVYSGNTLYISSDTEGTAEFTMAN